MTKGGGNIHAWFVTPGSSFLSKNKQASCKDFCALSDVIQGPAFRKDASNDSLVRFCKTDECFHAVSLSIEGRVLEPDVMHQARVCPILSSLKIPYLLLCLYFRFLISDF